MTSTIRTILIIAAIAFGLASSIHAGVLIGGWEHREASIAESVIAGVLTLGVVATLIRPAAARTIALGVMGFALLGTLVGVFTIIIGIGPQTVPDLVSHALLVAGLIGGLAATWRMRKSSPAAVGAARARTFSEDHRYVDKGER